MLFVILYRKVLIFTNTFQNYQINHFLLILHYFTFSANLSEQIVWLKSDIFGEMFTNINVLLSPSRYFWSKYVSLEFLKGIWDYFLAKDVITVPRWVKDLLINWVSLSLSPSTLLNVTLSLPAKSIRLREPFLSFSLFLETIWIVKIRWDLEECSLQLVSATFRFLLASSNSELIYSAPFTIYLLTESYELFLGNKRSFAASRYTSWIVTLT